MKLPALSLPAVLSPGRLTRLLDAEQAARWRAQFMAWWDGVEFDADAFETARAENAQARERLAGAPVAQPTELFEPPLEPDTPRIAALAKIWGKGRVCPGPDGDDLGFVSALSAPSGGHVAVVGPGGVALVKAIRRVHDGAVTVFEWRDDVIAPLKQQCQRLDGGDAISVRAFEIDSFLPAAEKFDALVSMDELSYAHRPQRFCQQIVRTLKPTGSAILECYCRTGEDDARIAFSTAFAEPHLLEVARLIEVFFEAGLRVDHQDEVTADHLQQVREGFKRLSAAIEAAPGLPAEIAREVAWEAEAWRARVGLLNRRALTRRQFIVSRMDG